ncbi:hypothetical protein RF11_16193 [Thelohanellus kitauei]|uniref:WH2 domain-containing protein n=1 Tax=Thelohanellus kitauei TaxID=669202 RepID=A0A0C2JYI5_THEKT|nr:hypothetical protein RF11_16193 [Thelohanellus kitauei]
MIPSFSKPQKKPTKIEIGNPYDFRHIKPTSDNDIIGYHPDHGFKLDECDTDWLLLFASMNLNGKLVSNPKIAQEIISLVEQYGGIDQVARVIRKAELAKLKSEKGQTVRKRRRRPPNPTQTSEPTEKGHGENLKATTHSIPPPPPPPPPPRSVKPDSESHPSPIRHDTSASDTDEMIAEEPKAPEPIQRSALLDQIKNTKTLLRPKKVPTNKGPVEEDTSIVGLLEQRLKAMNEMMADSDEDDSDGFGSDEWIC